MPIVLATVPGRMSLSLPSCAVPSVQRMTLLHNFIAIPLNYSLLLENVSLAKEEIFYFLTRFSELIEASIFISLLLLQNGQVFEDGAREKHATVWRCAGLQAYWLRSLYIQ